MKSEDDLRRERAISDLENFCLHHDHPEHCALEEVSDLAFEAFRNVDEEEVGTRMGMSKDTWNRCRAAVAVKKLRAGWMP